MIRGMWELGSRGMVGNSYRVLESKEEKLKELF